MKSEFRSPEIRKKSEIRNPNPGSALWEAIFRQSTLGNGLPLTHSPTHPPANHLYRCASAPLRLCARNSLPWIVASLLCATAFASPLTLEQAFALAQSNHPTLIAARADLTAAQATSETAGRLPDPEAVARIESAPLRDRTTASAEYVAGVSQSVPLGRRLPAARNVARKDIDLAAARVTLAEREVLGSVHSAFARALYFQAALQTFSNNLTGAETIARVTKARVDAGDAVREDLARAELEAIQSRAEARAAAAARQLALADLAAAIGNPPSAADAVAGSLEDVFGMPSLQRISAEVANAPAIRAAEAEVAVQKARVELARAERIPDLNLDLFYRRLQEARQDAFDAGIRIPLPFFSRPGARVRAAEAEANAAEATVASKRLNAENELRRALSDFHRAMETARISSAEILPRAQLILTNAEVRYKLGDTGLSDLIQKRRDANAAQVKYLEALAGAHEAWRTLLPYLTRRK